MAINRASVARQNEATRATIVAAVLDLLSREQEEISFQAVARAVGMSERTVFRHFPSHSALRAALIPAISARLGHIEPPDSVDGLPGYITRLYQACEANAGLVRSLVNTSFGRAILAEERTRRLDKITALLSCARVPPELARRAAATVRYLSSGVAWEFYRYQASLSLEDATAAALEALAGVLAPWNTRS